MLYALAWQDHLVIVGCLAMMIAVGAYLSLRQRNEDEYFLAGRQMPWFAVGVSVIASLLSSITYVAEPGEVWKSGITHMVGKMLAIPFEMAFVWACCIPFLMRFRITSAYEYLEARFDLATRRLGVALFILLVVSWMGFVVLVSSRVLAGVTAMPLGMVIATVGIVATFYTFLGGLRGVIWTDVFQVCLLVGGAVFIVAYVALATGSGPLVWYRSLADSQVGRLPLVSFDPFERATILTVALHMFVWHICTHTANQMTVQRYFSTRDLHAARRSFVTGSLLGVAINLLLTLVGLALFYFYLLHPGELPPSFDAGQGSHTDNIFPYFVVHQLPPGVAGGVLMALLAAAMSSIDSGINSLATVLTVERHRNQQSDAARHGTTAAVGDQVGWAKLVTIAFGCSITAAAYLLDQLTRDSNIIEMMPKSFNCFTGALGGLFFVAIFLRRASSRTALVATLCGLATSIALAYSRELFALERPVSFTWVMPGSLAVTFGIAWLMSRFEPLPRDPQAGLTWYTRHLAPTPPDEPAA